MKLWIPLAIALAIAPAALSHGFPMESADIRPHGTWDWVFDEPGTINYHCHQHPNMWGRVTVNFEGANFTRVEITDVGFVPATFTIGYYGVANWTNNGSLVHSVYQNTTMNHNHPSTSQGAPASGLLGTGVGLVVASWTTRRRTRSDGSTREAF